jgi:GTP cyclohydrolase I
MSLPYNIVELLDAHIKNLGYDTTTNGLEETPERVARYHSEYLQAGGDAIEEAAALLKPFDAPAPGVWVSTINSFSSTCEHHLAPFFGQARVVYLPDKHVTGLSKMYRALDVICRRLQIQERITVQMAEAVMRLKPVGVLVELTAQHTCMICRGICDATSSTRTRAMRGAFATDRDLREQAISLLK